MDFFDAEYQMLLTAALKKRLDPYYSPYGDGMVSTQRDVTFTATSERTGEAVGIEKICLTYASRAPAVFVSYASDTHQTMVLPMDYQSRRMNRYTLDRIEMGKVIAGLIENIIAAVEIRRALLASDPLLVSLEAAQ